MYSDPSGTDSVDDQAATVAAHQQLAEQEYHRYLAEQYVQHEAAVERKQALASAVARGGAIESGIAAQLQALPEIELQRRFEYSLENQPPTDPEALGRGLLRGLVGFGSLEELGRQIMPVQSTDEIVPFAGAMLPKLMRGANPLAPDPGEMVVGVVKTGMVATNDEAPRGQQLEAQGELVGTGISALLTTLGVAAAVTGKPAGAPLRVYEVGRHDALLTRSTVGDALDLHHAGQAHAMEQLVPSYSRSTGPAIALPRSEHVLIPNLKGPVGGSPRSQLARDVANLRQYTNAPNSSLQQLIDLHKLMFPKEFTRARRTVR